jgi:hypothetical protein
MHHSFQDKIMATTPYPPATDPEKIPDKDIKYEDDSEEPVGDPDAENLPEEDPDDEEDEESEGEPVNA